MTTYELGNKEKERKVYKTGEIEITGYTVTDVGQSKKKIIFECKHPEAEKPVQLSTVKYEKDGKLVTSGTWLTLDEEQKISKYSALGKILQFYNAKNLDALKKVKTAYDENQYLVIKAYD